MDAKQTLYYALGEVAYSIAMADGKVQKEEQKKFHDIIQQAQSKYDIDYDYADIIFQLFQKDKVDVNTSYDWAMKQFNLSGHHLTPELKARFIMFVEEVAKAYKPVTVDEMSILERFKRDIELVK